MAYDNNQQNLSALQSTEAKLVDYEQPNETEAGNRLPGIILSGSYYDRQKFATLNDAEFTELLTSIEGIGVDEFFVLYEELYDKIPSGSLDVGAGLTVNNTTEWTDLLAGIARDLKDALKDNEVPGIVPDIASIRQIIGSARTALAQINSEFATITTLLNNADPKTHAYLVERSSLKVKKLAEQFAALFNYISMLSLAYEQLSSDYAALVEENLELKRQINQLNDLIIKLTAPDISGFQILPDLFTLQTMRAKNPPQTFRAGDTVQVVVCGSANYDILIPSAYANYFEVSKVEGTSIWNIETNRAAAGKTMYLSGVSNEPTNAEANPAEQIVFVFPTDDELNLNLISSQGTRLELAISAKDSNGQSLYSVDELYEAGYAVDMTVGISGGVLPLTITTPLIRPNPFNEPNFTLTRLGDRTFRVTPHVQSTMPSAIIVRDAEGRTLNLDVIIREISTLQPREPVRVELSTNDLHWTRGTTTSLKITYPTDANPELIAVGLSSGVQFGFTTEFATAPVQINRWTKQIELFFHAGSEPGMWDCKVTGGPDTQTFTDYAGVIHVGATPLLVEIL